MTFFVIDKERKEEFAFLGYTTGKVYFTKKHIPDSGWRIYCCGQ